MFHLAQGLYSNWNKKEEYSILILGLDNAGKTTFLEKLKSIYNKNSKIIPPERILPTVGQNVGSITLDNKILKFWDVGGQNELRKLWVNYFDKAHAIIFLIDSNDSKRLKECQDTLLKILIVDRDTNDGKIIDNNIPILMLANKQDIENDGKLQIEDIKTYFNKIAQHLSARDSRVLPISALTGDGVKESIDWLLTRLVRNKQNKPPNYK